MITPEHIRAARAVLKWGTRDLAAASGVSLSTVTQFENGSDVLKTSADKIQATLEGLGIEFLDSGAPGIRWRKKEG